MRKIDEDLASFLFPIMFWRSDTYSQVGRRGWFEDYKLVLWKDANLSSDKETRLGALDNRSPSP